jgi:para-aminobenzoate synthetase component 1
VGYVDADRGTARLAVGIRTFWLDGGTLRFGTGAGITWGSDPAREWAETELKAARLVGLASTGGGTTEGHEEEARMGAVRA